MALGSFVCWIKKLRRSSALWLKLSKLSLGYKVRSFLRGRWLTLEQLPEGQDGDPVTWGDFLKEMFLIQPASRGLKQEFLGETSSLEVTLYI